MLLARSRWLGRARSFSVPALRREEGSIVKQRAILVVVVGVLFAALAASATYGGSSGSAAARLVRSAPIAGGGMPASVLVRDAWASVLRCQIRARCDQAATRWRFLSGRWTDQRDQGGVHRPRSTSTARNELGRLCRRASGDHRCHARRLDMRHKQRDRPRQRPHSRRHGNCTSRNGGSAPPSTKAGELHYAFFVDGRSILCEAA
jgi:hypothetical protein